MMRKRVGTILSLVLLGFLVGIRDGYIALWKDGQPEPVRVFPYQARMLPEADRKQLEQGIYIEDEQKLVELLEDYLS